MIGTGVRNAVAAAFILLGICSSAARASSTFVVFFDSGSSSLSPRATAILDNFAWAWEANDSAGVEIRGHADRVGPASINRRMSCARASAVRDYLVGRGVPRERIGISGWGDLFPLVETADEVAEAQNRRVDVVFTETGRPAEPDEKMFPDDPLPRKAVRCLSI